MFAGIINLTIALEVSSRGVARFYTAEEISDHKVALRIIGLLVYVFLLWRLYVIYACLCRSACCLDHGPDRFGDRLSDWYLVHLYQRSFLFYSKSVPMGASEQRRCMANSLFDVPFFTAGVSFLLAFVLGLGLQGLLIGMLVGSFMGTVFGLWHGCRAAAFAFS